MALLPGQVRYSVRVETADGIISEMSDIGPYHGAQWCVDMDKWGILRDQLLRFSFGVIEHLKHQGAEIQVPPKGAHHEEMKRAWNGD